MKTSKVKKKATSTMKSTMKERPPLKPNKDGVILLSGGNPQIAKADGDAPVKAYITAMPGWKRDVGARLDAIIVRCVPKVQKAVKWNSPFYGIEGQGFFLSYHCFNKYIKVTFFCGARLSPLPPIAAKDPHTRYLHIPEDGTIDEKQLAAWIKQAASIPGWDAGTPSNGGLSLKATS